METDLMAKVASVSVSDLSLGPSHGSIQYNVADGTSLVAVLGEIVNHLTAQDAKLEQVVQAERETSCRVGDLEVAVAARCSALESRVASLEDGLETALKRIEATDGEWSKEVRAVARRVEMLEEADVRIDSVESRMDELHDRSLNLEREMKAALADSRTVMTDAGPTSNHCMPQSFKNHSDGMDQDKVLDDNLEPHVAEKLSLIERELSGLRRNDNKFETLERTVFESVLPKMLEFRLGICKLSTKVAGSDSGFNSAAVLEGEGSAEDKLNVVSRQVTEGLSQLEDNLVYQHRRFEGLRATSEQLEEDLADMRSRLSTVHEMLGVSSRDQAWRESSNDDAPHRPLPEAHTRRAKQAGSLSGDECNIDDSFAAMARHEGSVEEDTLGKAAFYVSDQSSLSHAEPRDDEVPLIKDAAAPAPAGMSSWAMSSGHKDCGTTLDGFDGASDTTIRKEMARNQQVTAQCLDELSRRTDEIEARMAVIESLTPNQPAYPRSSLMGETDSRIPEEEDTLRRRLEALELQLTERISHPLDTFSTKCMCEDGVGGEDHSSMLPSVDPMSATAGGVSPRGDFARLIAEYVEAQLQMSEEQLKGNEIGHENDKGSNISDASFCMSSNGSPSLSNYTPIKKPWNVPNKHAIARLKLLVSRLQAAIKRKTREKGMRTIGPIFVTFSEYVDSAAEWIAKLPEASEIERLAKVRERDKVKRKLAADLFHHLFAKTKSEPVQRESVSARANTASNDGQEGTLATTKPLLCLSCRRPTSEQSARKGGRQLTAHHQFVGNVENAETVVWRGGFKMKFANSYYGGKAGSALMRGSGETPLRVNVNARQDTGPVYNVASPPPPKHQNRRAIIKGSGDPNAWSNADRFPAPTS